MKYIQAARNRMRRVRALVKPRSATLLSLVESGAALVVGDFLFN